MPTSKVLVAATNQSYFDVHKYEIEERGMDVVFTEKLPYHPGNVPNIVAEIIEQKPDAFVISRPDINLDESMDCCLQLIEECKKLNIPVLVDDSGRILARREIENAGAKIFSSPDTSPIRFAFEVAQAIKDRAKADIVR